jgi:hypothetical protein
VLSPASGAFRAASCFLPRVDPQLYSQALQQPNAQGRGALKAPPAIDRASPQQVAPSGPPLAFSQESTPNFIPKHFSGLPHKAGGAPKAPPAIDRASPASGAFEAASSFLSRINPQLYSQALQRPTTQCRRCKCTGCSESTACRYRTRHPALPPSKWRLPGRLMLSPKNQPPTLSPSTSAAYRTKQEVQMHRVLRKHRLPATAPGTRHLPRQVAPSRPPLVLSQSP